MFKKLFVAAMTWVVLSHPSFADPEFWVFEWPKTDFETTSVASWTEILSGGPPRDGIPALSDPDFLSVADETRIDPREPVITLEIVAAIPPDTSVPTASSTEPSLSLLETVANNASRSLELLQADRNIKIAIQNTL